MSYLQWLNPMDLDRRLHSVEMRYYNYTITRQWAQDIYPAIFLISALYVLAAILGQRFMRDRKAMDLSRTLVLWNIGLAWYTWLNFWRSGFHMMRDISSMGLAKAICSDGHYTGETALWSFMFAASKVVELGDTIFVVLKKKKLIVLHWYHHMTVLLYCWASFVEALGPGRLFATMNMFVHMLMYGYYATTASHLVRIPRWVNKVLTSLQLSQMVVGLAANVWVYFEMREGRHCNMTYNNLYWSFLMYFSYFVLFMNYFYSTYIAKKPKQT